MMEHVLDLGSFPLQLGGSLPQLRLGFAVHGQLNDAGDNCIILPSYYTGHRHSYDAMIGPGRPLDPEHWFIIVPDILGGGHSSSPSHGITPFPLVTIADNVNAQARLVFDILGVKHIALAAGWSMGAMQAFGWAALYPERVAALLPWCGAAACWPMNAVFLNGLEHCLLGAGDEDQRRRQFARVYAGWAYSPAFFRDRLYRELGAPDLEAFLCMWEADHMAIPAVDLLAMLKTWAAAAPGHLIPGTSHGATLARIRARTIIVANRQDRYFTADENEMEAGLIPHATLRILDSATGHCAGAPGRFSDDMSAIDGVLRHLLDD
jgi:homoserine O-acetyltransferase